MNVGLISYISILVNNNKNNGELEKNEIEKIKALSLNKSEVLIKSKFASEISKDDLLDISKVEITQENKDNFKSKGISASIELLEKNDGSNFDDDQGSLKVNLKLEKGKSVSQKIIKVYGFKTKLDAVSKNDLTLNVIDKEQILVSQIIDENKKIIDNKFSLSSKLLDLDKYTKNFELVTINENQQNVQLKLKLVLKDNPNIYKEFLYSFEDFGSEKLLEKEIEKIQTLNLNKSEVLIKSKFASEISKDDLLDISKVEISQENKDNFKSKGISASIELLEKNDGSNFDDDQGSLKVNLKFEKGKSIRQKTIQIFGFKTKLDVASQNDLTLNVNDKEQILASQIIDENGKIIDSKISLHSSIINLKNYKSVFQKLWVNDVEKQSKIKVTLTHNLNENIKKDFTYVIGDFKEFSIDEDIVISQTFKKVISVTHLEGLLSEIQEKENKIKKLQEYLDVTIPKNLDLKFEDFRGRGDYERDKKARLRYKLSKANIHNGSDENPDSKNGEKSSKLKEIEVTNFITSREHLNLEFQKIQSIKIADGSDLKNKSNKEIPDRSKIENNQISLLTKDNSEFLIPEGYELSLIAGVNKDKSSESGELRVYLQLKNKFSRTQKDKTFTLTGLKSVPSDKKEDQKA
ncbi:lipoprotein 17-related variable surface protein [Mycoplasmopsis pulmonis]|uniref:lipoprotein 17-related variable surface protein n=1 Tax=Mycoplasmopsis pulmonis TaxID=2107 RepID=UPI001004F162|nr:lipoprotein 17-related variable surface protein [Mycoplasmopsis pulmonis]VEU67898.1 Lipoprotein associated domain [Mycoplasmopsis pulmonis]